jgi:hypothetical protein
MEETNLLCIVDTEVERISLWDKNEKSSFKEYKI